MNKIIFSLVCLLVSFSLTACAHNDGRQNNMQAKPAATVEKTAGQSEAQGNRAADARIKLTIGDSQVIVRLYDNPTSRDLLSLLPLTLTFKDYVATEKIAYLPRKLATQGTDPGVNSADDFTYFAPWGNLAIFYKGKQAGGNGLLVLGTIETGKNVLTGLTADFTATIERIN